jgi:UPF0755 protein
MSKKKSASFLQNPPKWLKFTAPAGIAAILATVVGNIWWQGATAPVSSTPAEDIRIQVKPGMSAQSIGKELVDRGLIRDGLAWRLWSTMRSRTGNGSLQTGTYNLSPNQSLPEIGERIWTGKVVQTGFTVKEAWTIDKMAKYFETEKKFFSAADFVAATKKIPRDKFSWLPANITNLEGFLYPDTYTLPTEGITPDAIITVMLKQFEQKALPVHQQAGSTKYDLLQWVTLASIIDREAVIARERPLISGVFHNRLEKGMPLQSDPTVEYGLGISQTADRPLTFAEVKRPSPYNTYINPGLPPGPIGSPSLGSLEATLKPEATEHIFFVAKYDGTHVFSRTLSEHNAATVSIRQQRNNSRRQ